MTPNFSEGHRPAAARANFAALTGITAISVIIFLSMMFPRMLAYAPFLSGLIFATAYTVNYARLPIFSRKSLSWVFALIFLALISSLWSDHRAETFERALKAAVIVISGSLLVSLMPALARTCREYSPRVFYILPVSYFFGACLLAVDQHFNTPLYHLIRGMPLDKFKYIDVENRSVIFFSLLYMPMLSLVFCPGIFPLRAKRVLAVLVTVPVILIFFMTHSQSAQLALALATIVALLFPYRWRAAWYAVGVFIILAILLAPWLAIYMFKYLPPLIVHAPFLGDGQGYGAERLEIWDFVSRYALKRPLIGFGMEATRDVQAFDTKQLYQKSVTILHPHNFAIQLWMEFGVIGALFGAAALGRVVWYMARRMSTLQQRFALPTFTACLSAAAMSYGLWQSWWLGLLLFILALTIFAECFYAAPPATTSAQEAKTGNLENKG